VAGGAILVLNAGSSSIKFAVFGGDGTTQTKGSVTNIGGAARYQVGEVAQRRPAATHREALAHLLATLTAPGQPPLEAAAHRIVHGGPNLTVPAPITAEVLAEITACIPLAPLHNPHHIAAIEAVSVVAPDLPQFASFDTAFHANNPDVATRYALPDLPETSDLRRYGFHGLSYAALVRALPEVSGAPLPHRILALHLGAGASLCAIQDGQSVASTMGWSPLDGLTMAVRAGSIDANAALALAERVGVAGAKTILNHQSGLLGLGGSADMRALLADPSQEARFAVEHFCYWAVRHSGSMIAAMGGLDTIAFTGGIGEHAAPIRAQILDGLRWAGAAFDPVLNDQNSPRLHAKGAAVTAYVVPAAEEAEIARDAQALLTQGRQ